MIVVWCMMWGEMQTLTESTRKLFYDFCRRRRDDLNYADVVRVSFGAAAAGSPQRAALLATVKAVWAVNRVCGVATRRLSDMATWTQADILPLLSAARANKWIATAILAGPGRCDITDEMVHDRWVVSVGNITRVVRPNIGAIVVNFHTLIWYKEYVCSLDAIEDEAAHRELRAMVQSLHDTVTAVATSMRQQEPPTDVPPSPPG